ncbi:hypothetical protein U1Q18_031740 [Sarracenia purpurea var. burkii]
MEAKATLRVISLALNLGLSRVHLEGDALLIIQAINCQSEDISYIGGIIGSIKKIANLFQAFVCTQVRREANSVAHDLAQKALQSSGIPSCRLVPALDMEQGSTSIAVSL